MDVAAPRHAAHRSAPLRPATQRNDITMKRCPHCNRTMPVTEFYTYRTNGGKLVMQSWCRACKAERARSERASARRPDRRKEPRIMPHGERHPRAKLTANAAEQIKELRGYVPTRTVSSRFGISKSMVRAIWRGDYWSHICIPEQ